MQNVLLKSGTAGNAQIIVKGRGSQLDMPALPVTLPVRAQLIGSNGTCFEATYSTPTRNESDQFTAKSD